MKILGIDQSFTSSGFTIINEKEEVIEFGVIRTTKEDGDVFTRARIVTDKLKIIALIHDVELIGIEGLAFGGFGNATRDLAGLQFIIVDSFRPLELLITAPTAVKKLAMNGDKVKKVQKQDLYDHLPDDIKTRLRDAGLKKTKGLFDVVDSYWIAVYTLRNNSKKTVDINKEV